ncbi:MAG: hypothetical protein K8I27_05645 [Planctomycetes bacterium]|nr:hypothetical protein [Planctomycetota bacterium]
MPGHAYITHGDPNVLRDVAIQVAGGLGYGVEPQGAWRLKVSQGSLAASLFLGAFIAYCDFTVDVVSHADGTYHLLLHRNNPWWTGWIGMNRVKNRAIQLADAYGNELMRAGVPVLQRNDF